MPNRRTHEATLILGPDNTIAGTVRVNAALVNHGLVDPNNTTDQTVNHKIRLTCEPKVGPGDWQATCDDCDDEEEDENNILSVEAMVVGTGDLTVGTQGVLNVKRHMSLHGDFEIAGKWAKIQIDPHIIFDVDRFTSDLCPQ